MHQDIYLGIHHFEVIKIAARIDARNPWLRYRNVSLVCVKGKLLLGNENSGRKGRQKHTPSSRGVEGDVRPPSASGTGQQNDRDLLLAATFVRGHAQGVASCEKK